MSNAGLARELDMTLLINSSQELFTRFAFHYSGVIMGTMTSQITSLAIVCSTVNSGADQRKHQSSASLAFVRGIHRSPVNSPHKGPVMRRTFPFDDIIMWLSPEQFYRYPSWLLHRHWGNLTIPNEAKLKIYVKINMNHLRTKGVYIKYNKLQQTPFAYFMKYTAES